MEGSVLTESEVWKAGSGTNSSLNTDDRRIDYSPLMSDTVSDENLTKASENPGTTVHKGICSTIQEESEPEISPDQIKSLIPHEQRLEQDVSSTQTAVKSDEPSEPMCQQERSVNKEEEPPRKTEQQERSVNQAEEPPIKTKLQDLEQGIHQEITILVTNHDSSLESEEDEDFGEEKTSSSPTEPETPTEVGGPTEDESLNGSILVANIIEVSQIQKTRISFSEAEGPNLPGGQAQEDNENCKSESSNGTNSEQTQHENKQSTGSSPPTKTDSSCTQASTKAEPRALVNVNDSDLNDQPMQSEVAEVSARLNKIKSTESRDSGWLSQEAALSRSPGRQQHVQTQVSLEVMYQSVATSPMTPPEGAATFIFPSSFGKLANKCSTDEAQTIERKDAELQVGLKVESRSVATAPMSPVILTAPEVIPEPEPRPGVAAEEVPEPVPEVSWDEKGMTWEVYGAVVEVAVLGTAIQKHLEKQVKKYENKPSDLHTLTDVPHMDPTEIPALTPSSPPPTSEPRETSQAKVQSKNKEEKKVTRGRRRQNPFRQWSRNVRRPSCCSRPRQDEEN
ncbi:G protein-regulated inducer of neurite outgrowth 1-like [Xyrauchen texanus]|uniref:G protein-regulated inducer of neurite outgrowth 1-like n=1 Tax=Xyrauchen texanus TaxID=154827 RepID=UPI002242989B|nr:G protein-regulated inducer of neurite outgrowth 1-like [Xyrauchen texanus]